MSPRFRCGYRTFSIDEAQTFVAAAFPHEDAMLTKTSFTIRLHPSDDVVIARQQLVSGTTLLDENVKISGLVPPGHKVATRAIGQGEPVKRYNQILGFAKRPLRPREHVHLHNLAMRHF